MAAVRPVVLATGGTGGHVFPAEALAGELEARGVPFTLVTDSRGRQWQGALSRRPIHYIHSASPTALHGEKGAGAVLAGAGTVRRLASPGSHRAVRGGRLRRLCLGSDHARGPPAPPAVRTSRAERGSGTRQSPRAGRRGGASPHRLPGHVTSTATREPDWSAIRCARRCARSGTSPTARPARAG